MKRYPFPKQYRCCKQREIQCVFQSNNFISSPPLKIYYIINNSTSYVPCKVAISVPRKLFKKAVVRNRIKRRIREAYRKAAPDLFEQLRQKQLQLLLAIVYVCHQDLTYAKIEHALLKALSVLHDKLDNLQESSNHQKSPA